MIWIMSDSSEMHSWFFLSHTGCILMINFHWEAARWGMESMAWHTMRDLANWYPRCCKNGGANCRTRKTSVNEKDADTVFNWRTGGNKLGCLKQRARRRTLAASFWEAIDKRFRSGLGSIRKWSLFDTDFDLIRAQWMQLCNTSGNNEAGWEGRSVRTKQWNLPKLLHCPLWLEMVRVGGTKYGPNLADFMPSCEQEAAMPLTLLSAHRYLQIGNAPLNFEAACIISCCLRPRQIHGVLHLGLSGGDAQSPKNMQRKQRCTWIFWQCCALSNIILSNPCPNLFKS